MRSARLPLPVIGVLLAALVGGALFTMLRERPVQVSPAPSAADPACAVIAARLPATVAGQARRATTSRSVSVAAWGDPAVILRCGVAQPDPTPDCQNIDGVDWVYRTLDDGTAFTTYGRDPAVQVLVPNSYAPEPLRLPDFSTAVSVVAQGERRCS